jgi:hypothetical protein
MAPLAPPGDVDIADFLAEDLPERPGDVIGRDRGGAGEGVHLALVALLGQDLRRHLSDVPGVDHPQPAILASNNSAISGGNGSRAANSSKVSSA